MMNEDLLHKFGEIQYLKGRIDELHKALPTVLDLNRKRKLDMRLSKYYNKLRATDELAYHLYLVERETQTVSKEKSKRNIEELLREIKTIVTDNTLIEKIDKQIEKYG
jgi:polyhydroxyalkanoate synthesis regulator phasin